MASDDEKNLAMAMAMAMEIDGPGKDQGKEEAVSFNTHKRPRGRPKGCTNKNKQQPLSFDDSLSVSSYGSNFTPHFITLTEGEEVVSRMRGFALSHPPKSLLTILSANGSVSMVDICADYGNGMFEILSLSWTVELDEDHSSENFGIGTSLNVLLADSETGKVFGGVAQILVAATPIKIIVGSFEQDIGTSFLSRGPRPRPRPVPDQNTGPSIGEILAELIDSDIPIEDYDKLLGINE
ncbi:AT-hook motif nuclear-localized protein 10-like [Humulus lupulus]|uniref:AT-hook motif nuclear-localized protein 10-like n=1 Tax=Humulus lupulus TaxID=3486 RepID=UPI002B403872|nr:AT-hook motif nuclear-localized protein 10-like [Humulus lupulus]